MESKCKYLNCENSVRCKGLCSYHYEKERKQKKGIICSTPGCRRVVFCKELCEYHYQREHLGRKRINVKASGEKCAYPGCNREATARNYCQKHYMRRWRHEEIVPDGYRREGHRKCIYCYMRTLDGTRLCGEHKGWPTTCVICGYERYIESAHIIPEASGAPKEDWNIMPLCPNHHRLYDHNLLLEQEKECVLEYIKRAELKFTALREEK